VFLFIWLFSTTLLLKKLVSTLGAGYSIFLFECISLHVSIGYPGFILTAISTYFENCMGLDCFYRIIES